MFKDGDAVQLLKKTEFGSRTLPKNLTGYVISVREEQYIRVLFPGHPPVTVMHYELAQTKAEVEMQVKAKDLKLWDKIYVIDDRWGEVYELTQNGKEVDVSIWIDDGIEYVSYGKKERVRIKR